MDEEKKTVDLNGKFSFKVDTKGRMALPAKFRKFISTDDFVVTQDLHSDCLYVFIGNDEFNAWVDRIFEDKFGGYHESNTKEARLRTVMKGRSADVSADTAGRITLSQEMRAAVGIDRDVTIVGNKGYFEVWDAKRYEDLEQELDFDVLFG